MITSSPVSLPILTHLSGLWREHKHMVPDDISSIPLSFSTILTWGERCDVIEYCVLVLGLKFRELDRNGGGRSR
jgi:hypothetical protein